MIQPTRAGVTDFMWTEAISRTNPRYVRPALMKDKPASARPITIFSLRPLPAVSMSASGFDVISISGNSAPRPSRLPGSLRPTRRGPKAVVSASGRSLSPLSAGADPRRDH